MVLPLPIMKMLENLVSKLLALASFTSYKRTRVSLAVGDHINSFQVSTSRNHAQVPSVKLDEISNLASHQINLNGVIHRDEGLKVADGANIKGHQMQNSFCPAKIFLT